MVGALVKEGANVKAYDPKANSAFAEYFPQITYCQSWKETVKDTDAVALMTEWNEFRGMDLSVLKNQLINPVILDTRNVLNMYELLKLGFTFDNVGRLKPSES